MRGTLGLATIAVSRFQQRQSCPACGRDVLSVANALSRSRRLPPATAIELHVDQISPAALDQRVDQLGIELSAPGVQGEQNHGGVERLGGRLGIGSPSTPFGFAALDQLS